MHKYDFSNDEQKVYNLALDLARNDFSLDGEVKKRDLEDALRNTINNDILKGKTLYQAYRRNKTVLFEIIEEIVTTTIGEDILDSPFINEFVEVKNRALGDNTAFYSEGGMLSVASFAGNHWDTNRQSIDLGEEFTLPKEWYYIRPLASICLTAFTLSSRMLPIPSLLSSLRAATPRKLLATFAIWFRLLAVMVL